MLSAPEGKGIGNVVTHNTPVIVPVLKAFMSTHSLLQLLIRHVHEPCTSSSRQVGNHCYEDLKIAQYGDILEQTSVIQEIQTLRCPIVSYDLFRLA